MSIWRRCFNLFLTLSFINSFIPSAYAVNSIEDIDTHFIVTKNANGINLKIRDRQDTFLDAQLNNQSPRSIQNERYELKRFDTGYKLKYKGLDQSRLSLLIDFNSDIYFKKATDTCVDQKKTWAFQTTGKLVNTRNILFHYLYTQSNEFHNYGILKSYAGQLDQKYGFNRGVIHFGDDTPVLELALYAPQLPAIDHDAQPRSDFTSDHYGVILAHNGNQPIIGYSRNSNPIVTKPVFDDYGVLIAHSDLTISGLTYRALGLSDVENFNLQSNADIDVQQKMIVQQDLTGAAQRIENHGEFFIGCVQPHNFKVNELINNNVICFSKPSELITENNFDNQTGYIFSSSNLSIGSRRKVAHVGVVAGKSAVKLAVLEACEAAQINSALENSAVFSEKEKIKILLRIITHTDHLLNTITDHYRTGQFGFRQFTHKTETGYVFQKRTTEIEEKIIEEERLIPEGLQKAMLALDQRQAALNKFKQLLKNKLRGLGKINGDAKAILSALSHALASTGYDQDEIADIFNDDDVQTALSNLLYYDEYTDEIKNAITAATTTNKIADFVTKIGNNAASASKNTVQWVLAHKEVALDALCGAVTVANSICPHPYLRVPLVACGVGNGYRSFRAVQNISKPQLANILYNRSQSNSQSTTSQHRPQVHGYAQAPINLSAFPKAQKVAPKTSVQGGGKKRERWEDKKHIYEWDSRHAAVEKYNKNGKHLGKFNHETGQQLKPAKPTRIIKP